MTKRGWGELGGLFAVTQLEVRSLTCALGHYSVILEFILREYTFLNSALPIVFMRAPFTRIIVQFEVTRSTEIQPPRHVITLQDIT